jgi:hypothetical protein
LGNNLFNLDGLFAHPDRRHNLERLIKPKALIYIATDYAKNAFKATHRLNWVSNRPIYNQQA